jgi:integrase
MAADTPTRRRGRRGQGTCYEQRPGLWVAQLMASGRRVSTTGTSENEARGRLAAKVKEIAAEPEPGRGVVPTVEELLTTWLTRLRDDKLVKPQTWHGYRAKVNNYLIPGLGHLRVDKVTRRHVKDMLEDARTGELSGEPQSKSNRTHMHRVLCTAFNYAVDEEYVEVNVPKLVKSPGMDEYEPYILSAEEAARLLTAAQEHRMYAAVVLGVVLAPRISEVLGLRRPDVDVLARKLRIATTVQTDYDYRLILGPPKSRASKRSVDMPELVAAAMADHLAAQETPNVLVFPSASGGLLSRHNFHRDVWRPLLRRAALLDAEGLPLLRFHDLRHSANTVLRQAGVDAVTRARLLGHKPDVNETVYGHTTDRLMAEAAAKLDQAHALPSAAEV